MISAYSFRCRNIYFLLSFLSTYKDNLLCTYVQIFFFVKIFVHVHIIPNNLYKRAEYLKFLSAKENKPKKERNKEKRKYNILVLVHCIRTSK